jgi:RNA polymerase sigma factor (sigma-70 family)
MILMQTLEYTTTQHTDLAEGLVAQQILSGDQRAFEVLVHRYSGLLFTFIYRFLKDYDAACDILQLVFLQLHLCLPSLCTDEPLKPWLLQVARNRCLDQLRRKSALPFSVVEVESDTDDVSPLESIPDTRPLPEEIAERHDLQEHLHNAIQALPPKMRVIVLLRYTSQLTFPEISQVLNIPQATAKTYFQRAKPLLRVALMSQLEGVPLCEA